MKRPNLTQAELDRIAELTEGGRLSAGQIAVKIGCSTGSVTWAQLRIGADRYPDRELPAVPTERRQYMRNGHPIRAYTQDDDARRSPPPGRYAPGGRWERIMRVLATDGPLKRSQIFAATRRPIILTSGLAGPAHSGPAHSGPAHSGKAERAKIWRALAGLEHLGFVDQRPDARFVLTPRGEHALRDGDAV